MTEQELNSILQLIQSGVNINADEKNKVAELLEQMNKKSSHKVRRSVISSSLDNIANKKSVQAFFACL